MNNRFMCRAATVATGAALVLSASGTAFAAPSASSGAANLQCFSGPSDNTIYGGACATTGKNRNGAVLNNNSSNPNGDYSGVYLNKKDLNGKALGKIAALGYTYAGTTAAGPGDLSLNFGVDITGDGLSDDYAFVDAFYCPGTDGVVDVINDAVCGIWFHGEEFANWADFVAQHPTAKVGKDGQAFIIAERTLTEASATWTISNVVLGKV